MEHWRGVHAPREHVLVEAGIGLRRVVPATGLGR